MYTIPIYGTIGEDFTFDMLLEHLLKAKDEKDIELDFNSLGGFVHEGFRMRDKLLESGKNITAKNSGNVCSIAVNIWLTASKRIFDISKGEFVIHNPWTELSGDSKTFLQASEDLKSVEKQIIKNYCEATGIDKSVISGFMSMDKPLTAEQITLLNLAEVIGTEQIKSTCTPVAYYNQISNMDTKKIDEKLGLLETILNKIVALVSPIKSMVLQDVDGKQIDFGAAKTLEEITIGITGVTIDGKPANGTYTMPTGQKMVFVDSTLTDIIEPETELDKVKKENEELKNKLEAKSKELDEFKNSVNQELATVTAEFKNFKAQFVPQNPNPNTPPAPPVEPCLSWKPKQKK